MANHPDCNSPKTPRATHPLSRDQRNGHLLLSLENGEHVMKTWLENPFTTGKIWETSKGKSIRKSEKPSLFSFLSGCTSTRQNGGDLQSGMLPNLDCTLCNGHDFSASCRWESVQDSTTPLCRVLQMALKPCINYVQSGIRESTIEAWGVQEQHQTVRPCESCLEWHSPPHASTSCIASWN